MPFCRLSVPVLASLIATTLLAGCGSSHSGGSFTPTASGASSAAELAGQSITLYNGQHEQTTSMLVAAFEKQTSMKVNIRSDDEATLANQILQEGQSSPADVFYTENTPALEPLREQGLLAPIAPSTLASVPARYSSAQGDWVGRLGARVGARLQHRPGQPAELPNSILELAEPKWKGKLGFAPSETDFQPLITSITKFDGTAAAEKWLKALKANSKIYPDNETVVAQVNNGESAVGLINHYYWYRLRDEVGADRHCIRPSLLRPAQPRRPGQRVRSSHSEVQLHTRRRHKPSSRFSSARTAKK